jgi:hypothetical protein
MVVHPCPTPIQITVIHYIALDDNFVVMDIYEAILFL